MAQHYNPALSEEPMYKTANVISSGARETLLGLLQKSGRLIPPCEYDKVPNYGVIEYLDDPIDSEPFIHEEDE
ncbi:MAG: DUF3134 family protein [Synechococcaceae cyanobacterium SM2_3_1]|nr:DUF3134 family protein [Synechococcaceae cyanobacterium SM2_3_1]